jgi:quinol monooxygenase YgiN
MIRHMVFFTALRQANVAGMIKGLERLGTIAGVDHFEVRRNEKLDQIGNEVDVVVYAEFADAEALKAYKNDPIYAAVTAEVRPLRAFRFAADISA